MKRLIVCAIVLASFVAPAFAAKNSQSLTIGQPVQIGSTQLSAGAYKVSWTGTGESVQVTLAQNGQSPVTVPAKLVETKDPIRSYTVIHVNGSDQLQELHLNKVNLILQPDSTTAGAQ